MSLECYLEEPCRPESRRAGVAGRRGGARRQRWRRRAGRRHEPNRCRSAERFGTLVSSGFLKNLSSAAMAAAFGCAWVRDAGKGRQHGLAEPWARARWVQAAGGRAVTAQCAPGGARAARNCCLNSRARGSPALAPPSLARALPRPPPARAPHHTAASQLHHHPLSHPHSLSSAQLLNLPTWLPPPASGLALAARSQAHRLVRRYALL